MLTPHVCVTRVHMVHKSTLSTSSTRSTRSTRSTPSTRVTHAFKRNTVQENFKFFYLLKYLSYKIENMEATFIDIINSVDWSDLSFREMFKFRSILEDHLAICEGLKHIHLICIKLKSRDRIHRAWAGNWPNCHWPKPHKACRCCLRQHFTNYLLAHAPVLPGTSGTTIKTLSPWPPNAVEPNRPPQHQNLGKCWLNFTVSIETRSIRSTLSPRSTLSTRSTQTWRCMYINTLFVPTTFKG